MGFINVRLTTDKLDSLIKNTPNAADQATETAAELIINDIRDHWSGSSPSAPGASPAVVTGNLDESLTAIKISGGERPTYQLGATAEYGGYLEFGTYKMAKRPYIYPAMKRMRNQLRDVFKVIFKS